MTVKVNNLEVLIHVKEAMLKLIYHFNSIKSMFRPFFFIRLNKKLKCKIRSFTFLKKPFILLNPDQNISLDLLE